MTHTLAVNRRDFLTLARGSVALSWAIGSGFAGFVPAVEAVPLEVLHQWEARTLLAMARTLFPHDFLADDYYMIVVAALDGKANSDAQIASMLREGLGELGTTFTLRPEMQREYVLRAIETSPFFTFVYNLTLNTLYGNTGVWKILGYEGSSLEHGGYINRGFDDIDWLPSD